MKQKFIILITKLTIICSIIPIFCLLLYIILSIFGITVFDNTDSDTLKAIFLLPFFFFGLLLIFEIMIFGNKMGLKETQKLEFISENVQKGNLESYLLKMKYNYFNVNSYTKMYYILINKKLKIYISIDYIFDKFNSKEINELIKLCYRQYIEKNLDSNDYNYTIVNIIFNCQRTDNKLLLYLRKNIVQKIDYFQIPICINYSDNQIIIPSQEANLFNFGYRVYKNEKKTLLKIFTNEK